MDLCWEEGAAKHSRRPIRWFDATLCWKELFLLILYLESMSSVNCTWASWGKCVCVCVSSVQTNRIDDVLCGNKSLFHTKTISSRVGNQTVRPRCLIILILTERWLWGYFRCRRGRPSRRQEHDFVMFVMSEHWLTQRGLKRFPPRWSSKDARALCAGCTVARFAIRINEKSERCLVKWNCCVSHLPTVCH